MEENISSKIFYIEAKDDCGNIKCGTGVLLRCLNGKGYFCDIVITCFHIINFSDTSEKLANEIKVWPSFCALSNPDNENYTLAKPCIARVKNACPSASDLVILELEVEIGIKGISNYKWDIDSTTPVQIYGYPLGAKRITEMEKGIVVPEIIDGKISGGPVSSIYAVDCSTTPKDGLSGGAVISNGSLIGIWRGRNEIHSKGITIGCFWFEKLNYLLENYSGFLSLPQKIPKNHLLYNSLIKLNFFNQVYHFRKYIEKNRTGAFLVHGCEHGGQQWLLKRLIEKTIPNSAAISPIKVQLNNRSTSTRNSTELWKQIGRKIKLPNSNQNLVIDALINKLKTNHVVIIFSEVNDKDRNYLENLIREIWHPLVSRAKDPSYLLLMFLIDYQGCVSRWGIDLDIELGKDWELKVESLSEHVIQSWLEENQEQISTHKLTSNAAKEIFCNSENGKPQLVLKCIYELAGYDWYSEGEERWIKI